MRCLLSALGARGSKWKWEIWSSTPERGGVFLKRSERTFEFVDFLANFSTTLGLRTRAFRPGDGSS